MRSFGHHKHQSTVRDVFSQNGQSSQMLSLSVCDSPHNTCDTDTNLKANHHSSSCFALIRITWLILHASRCFIGILANVRTVAISSPQLHENSLPSSYQISRRATMQLKHVLSQMAHPSPHRRRDKT